MYDCVFAHACRPQYVYICMCVRKREKRIREAQCLHVANLCTVLCSVMVVWYAQQQLDFKFM